VNLNSSEKEKDKGFVIEVDKEGTLQAFSIILDNAAKFVKEGNATINVDTNNTTNNNNVILMEIQEKLP
jgi:signal transduction histidine kinase